MSELKYYIQNNDNNQFWNSSKINIYVKQWDADKLGSDTGVWCCVKQIPTCWWQAD